MIQNTTTTTLTMTDLLPAGLTFVNGSLTLTPTNAGTVGSAPPNLVNGLVITAGQQVTVTFAATIQPAAAGLSLTNTATLTDGLALNLSSEAIIQVHDIPIAGLSASNNSPTILGNSTSLNATVMTGTHVVYTWDFGDGNNGNGANPSHIYATPGTYTATVTANNFGSSQTDTTTVTIHDIAIVGLTAGNNSPTILGNTTTFNASVTAGTNVVYTWDFGDGNNGSGANPTHNYILPGVYTATVTANNFGSSQTTITIVTINDIPINGLSVGNNSPTVLGDTTTFNASTTAGTNVIYTWDFGDSGTGTGANPAHVYASPGSYVATVTASNMGSSQTGNVPVLITDVPITGLTANSDSPTLLGMSTLFTATTTSGSNVVYTWDFGDGTTGSGFNPSHTYTQTGSYVATVTANNFGNNQTDTTNVIVINVPIAGLTANNNGPATIGQVISFTATITAGSNASFAWDFDDGNSGMGANITHTYILTGWYTATVTAFNENNSQTTTTPVIVYDEPVGGLAASSDGLQVVGQPILFTAIITRGTNVTYTWDFGDGTTGRDITTTHTYTTPDTYTVTVTAKNFGDRQEVTIPVTITAHIEWIYLPIAMTSPKWQQVDDEFTFQTRSLVVCPSDPDIRYVGTFEKGLYTWHDSQWQQVTGGQAPSATGSVYGLAFAGEDCTQLYAASLGEGVRKLDGNTWSEVTDASLAQARTVVVREGQVFIGGDFGVRYASIHDPQPVWSVTGIDSLVISLTLNENCVFAPVWGVAVRANCNATNPQDWSDFGTPIDNVSIYEAMGEGTDNESVAISLIGTSNRLYTWNNDLWLATDAPARITYALAKTDGFYMAGQGGGGGVLYHITGPDLRSGWQSLGLWPNQVQDVRDLYYDSTEKVLYAATSNGVWAWHMVP